MDAVKQSQLPHSMKVTATALPPECIVDIVKAVCATGSAENTWGGVTILAISHTCRAFRSAIDEEVWRGWCFARRVGRYEDSWRHTALSLMNEASHYHTRYYKTCTIADSAPRYTFPFSATEITKRGINLQPSYMWESTFFPWCDPWQTVGRTRRSSQEGRPAVCLHTFATEPPCQGLVVRFDEYILDLPALEHLLIANSDGVTVADVLNGIHEWMQTPLTASQKTYLYAYHTDSSLEAEVVDLLAEASEGVQGREPTASKTLRRAKREAFMLAHERRVDLATLPFGGCKPMKPGSVTFTMKWRTHKPGDDWMPASEAPEF